MRTTERGSGPALGDWFYIGELDKYVHILKIVGTRFLTVSDGSYKYKRESVNESGM